MLEQILKKINDRGWNLYQFGAEESLDLAVPRGAATKLVADRNYVVIPRISQDRDLAKVQEAMSVISRRNVLPIMVYSGNALPLVFFSLKKRQVIVHAETDVAIDYSSFYENLDTLCSGYIS